MSHPSLTPAESEVLESLAEEAGEVVQACMKILRHGLSNFHPADPDRTTNGVLLGRELGNLRFLQEQLHLIGCISDLDVLVGERLKESNWPRYTYHQPHSRNKP